MPSVPAGKAATARRMLGLGLFFERTAETVRNVREFKIAKSAEERLAIVDREEAIRWAIDNARSGDVILLAGKGHEDYQVVGREKHHMDEREIVAEYIERRKQA